MVDIQSKSPSKKSDICLNQSPQAGSQDIAQDRQFKDSLAQLSLDDIPNKQLLPLTTDFEDDSDLSNKSFHKPTLCSKICTHLHNHRIFYIIGLIVVTTTILFTIPPTQKYIKTMISENLQHLHNFSQNHYWSFNVICIIIHILITVCFIPGKAILTLTICFVTKELYRSTIVSFVGSNLSIVIVYILVKCFLRARIYQSYCESETFILLNMMVLEKPWVASPIIWFFFIPMSLKAYLLSVTPMTFLQYWIGEIPIGLIYSFMFSLIGYEQKDLQDSSKGFMHLTNGLTTTQIINIFMSLLFIVFSIGLGAYLWILFKKKMRRFKRGSIFLDRNFLIMPDTGVVIEKNSEKCDSNHQ